MKKKLIETLKKFDEKTVLVIGDYCIDEYIEGDASSIAPEAPIPRVTVGSVWTIVGAAGNVASGVRALGAKTYAAGIIGEDIGSKELIDKLKERGVNTEFMVFQKDRVTPKYSRILVGGSHYPKQHAIRFDFENKDYITKECSEELLKFIENNSDKFDAIIVADYDEVGKGVVSNDLLKKIAEIGRQKKIILIGDSRKNLISFEDFSYIVPNIFEAEMAHGKMIKSEQELFEAIKGLIERLRLKGILITKGQEGMDLFEKKESILKKTSIPVFSRKVIDVTGAGDSVTCAFALSLCSGLNPKEASLMASYAASVTVLKEGVVAVTKEELEKVILDSENKAIN